MSRRRPRSTLFPYTTLFRSEHVRRQRLRLLENLVDAHHDGGSADGGAAAAIGVAAVMRNVGVAVKDDDVFDRDRKSTRLNSSHPSISYAVFCLKKKTNTTQP